MFKTYFKIAWRSLWKNKFYSVINISGLAVGLATGIMLLLWVQNELSYDKFHRKADVIYKINSQMGTGTSEQVWEGSPGPLALFCKQSIPEVLDVVRINNIDEPLLFTYQDKKFTESKLAFVDSTFFSMFDFKLLESSVGKPFPNINSIILTSSAANKYFGNKKAIGKILVTDQGDFSVSGVMQDFPENSSIQYDMLLPMSLYAELFKQGGGNGNWKTMDEDLGNFYFKTYIQVQESASPESVAQKLSHIYFTKRGENGQGNIFSVQPLKTLHLTASDGSNSGLQKVNIFFVVAILILLIASINYVNLSTARSLIRAKEVSIRKIIGAKKQQLFFQFTLETLVLFSFATVLAIVLILLLMPLYNNLSGKTLSFSLTDINVWKAAGLAVLGTLIASSIYPAILLSSFKPIESLKGKFTSGLDIVSLRKALVIFQFATSVILLVCTIIMSSQMHFIKNKDLGYDKSYVFSVPLTREAVSHLDAVKTELKKQPGILNVATSDAYDISNISSSTGDIDWETKPVNSSMIITQVAIDKDFIPAMKMQFIEGNNFTGMPSDSAHYILNETAVKEMGLKPPYAGQAISLHNWKGTIIGVVKDFNFKSLKEKITPLIFFTRWKGNILYARTTAGNVQQAIAAAEKKYKKYVGDIPFSYNFLDKSFEAQYKADQRAGTLFNVFAGIAIFISCLGLFGLANYTAQVKTKEIGIRKVLGASVAGIVQLISKDFLKLIIIAIIIATPISWWAMNKGLQSFEYRINISWWIFILVGIIAICIALFTISFQAIKAAVANPVKSLRTE